MRSVLLAIIPLLAGCPTTGSTVVDTRTMEKPTTVHCKVATPKECQGTYAVDALQPGADPVQVNRALRAEIEQRSACEIKLKAAIQGCNDAK